MIVNEDLIEMAKLRTVELIENKIERFRTLKLERMFEHSSKEALIKVI